MPGEELQRHHSVVRKVKQINGVDDLLRRNLQVNHAKVVLQAMTDKGDATEMLTLV